MNYAIYIHLEVNKWKKGKRISVCVCVCVCVLGNSNEEWLGIVASIHI